MKIFVTTKIFRSRGPEYPLYRRVRRWKDREHQEGDPVPRLRGRLQAQDQQPSPSHGKLVIIDKNYNQSILLDSCLPVLLQLLAHISPPDNINSESGLN